MTSFDRDFDDLTFDAELFDYLVHTLSPGILTATANALILQAKINGTPLSMQATANLLALVALQEGNQSQDVMRADASLLSLTDRQPNTISLPSMQATVNQLSLSSVGQTVNQAIMAKAMAFATGLPLSIIERAISMAVCIIPARGRISYGDFVLNQKPYYVNLLGVYSAANRSVTRAKLLRPGSTRISTQYEEKIIAVSGSIVASGKSKASMETALDNLHKYLSLPLQDMRVGFEDERYYSPVELEGELQVEWPEDSRQQITWQARFLAYDPFAFSVNTESEVDTNPLSQVSGNHRSKSMIVIPNGSIYTYPVINISFPAGSPSPYGTTVLWVTNSSVNPSQTLQITRTFNASDSIEIDCVAQTVKINTIIEDFEGKFLYLDPRLESNTIEIHTTSTVNSTLTVSVSWRNRFLA